ncbi:MAG: anaerobic glycerol-3-phosphate dehydrogenase subunit C [Planctomycetota bacterium]
MEADEVESVAEDLGKVIGGEVLGDILHRAAYSSDASIYQILPVCVVAPRGAVDVSVVVKYARREGIAVAGRGAGSGVAGESLCGGIVLDMSRHMKRILGVEEDGERVICEPGVVLDDLNEYLLRYGRKIGPDPSSGNRATVGGCVANNATGAHSIAYGYMGDYVERVEAVLADGAVAEFVNDFEPAGDETEARGIAKRCLDVLGGKEEVIDRAVPAAKRNRSGYSIAGVCHDGKIDMAKLLAGSEGTLCVFTKIVLRTVAIEGSRGLLELEFDSLEKMARSVPVIVGGGALACELMDERLMGMAREALPEYRDIYPAGAAVILIVEHVGADEAEVRAKIEAMEAAVGGLASGQRVIFDEQQQERIWQSRKDAVPLLGRRKGREHPVAFIEDVSVANDKLGEYIGRIKEIEKQYGVEMSFYGHAGEGELHMRPYLDLSRADEVEKMVSIANEVFSVAWSLGGAISGEHGDGLVRTAFIRRQYGDEYYRLLCAVKNIFDPEGLMNPGKIISSEVLDKVMTRNLKAENKLLAERVKTELVFEGDELADEVEQCSGCGVCLSRGEDLRMCPVFRALGEELGSSRAKANIIRYWMSGGISEKEFESREFREFLDLCVNCKACSLQCPSGVDISKMMTAARAEYVKRKGLRRTERLLSLNRYLSMMGSMFSSAANVVTGLGVFKWSLEKAVGVDRRRGMPKFGRGSFLSAGRKYLEECGPIERPVDRVAYFVDTYANYNDHELGFAVLKVLRHNDIEVILPRQRPAPLPSIVYGDVKHARRELSYSMKYLSEAVRDGYKIVCSEPSAALCLKQEARHYVSLGDVSSVPERAYEIVDYLLGLFEEGKLKRPAKGLEKKYVYHCPCHVLATGGGSKSIRLLKELCGLEVTDLKAGCCGLAGTFGMQKKNYDLSSQISRRLREALEKSAVKEVLTECGACGMQIEHISDVVVSHPIKIVAECYNCI